MSATTKRPFPTSTPTPTRPSSTSSTMPITTINPTETTTNSRGSRHLRPRALLLVLQEKVLRRARRAVGVDLPDGALVPALRAREAGPPLRPLPQEGAGAGVLHHLLVAHPPVVDDRAVFPCRDEATHVPTRGSPRLDRGHDVLGGIGGKCHVLVVGGRGGGDPRGGGGGAAAAAGEDEGLHADLCCCRCCCCCCCCCYC